MKLELFYTQSCPYCDKVKAFLQQHGIDFVDFVDASVPANAERLVREGGKDQVPCLFIDGTPLYESGDIIKKLETLLPAGNIVESVTDAVKTHIDDAKAQFDNVKDGVKEQIDSVKSQVEDLCADGACSISKFLKK